MKIGILRIRIRRRMAFTSALDSQNSASSAQVTIETRSASARCVAINRRAGPSRCTRRSTSKSDQKVVSVSTVCFALPLAQLLQTVQVDPFDHTLVQFLKMLFQ